MRAVTVFLGVLLSTAAIADPGQPRGTIPAIGLEPTWSAQESARREHIERRMQQERQRRTEAADDAARTAKARYATALAATMASNKCPQEWAVYSLNGATLSFEMNRRSIETGWGVVLRSPTAPVRFYAVIGNGVPQLHIISEDSRWLSSTIDFRAENGTQEWGLAGKPASPTLTLPGFGPKGTWRLTGCAKP